MFLLYSSPFRPLARVSLRSVLSSVDERGCSIVLKCRVGLHSQLHGVRCVNEHTNRTNRNHCLGVALMLSLTWSFMSKRLLPMQSTS